MDKLIFLKFELVTFNQGVVGLISAQSIYYAHTKTIAGQVRASKNACQEQWNGTITANNAE